ncbi:hypothetical protein GGI43DRAFT_399052, partial [Trichoderma evansii]
SKAAGNVIPFGALMMSMISAFQSFIRDQQESSTEHPDEQCPVKIFIGSQS